jgi:hypothetical protein
MKRPIYAALDLHSRHSVLGNMDHDGQTQPRMRFATEANILRAQVEGLRQRRRPLYLAMVAGALTRWASDWLDGSTSPHKTRCTHYAAEDTEQDHRCECI